MVGGIVEYERS